MAIDWTVPQLSYEELHAQLDALQTERNAAVAEAAMWQRRLLSMQKERDQARADLRACDKSHEEWEAAHAELLQTLHRTQMRLADAKWQNDLDAGMAVHYQTLIWLFATGQLTPGDVPDGDKWKPEGVPQLGSCNSDPR